MTQRDSAAEGRRMMTEVPGPDQQGPTCDLVAVSFGVTGFDRAGITVRFVGERGEVLDLHLNATVAEALRHCLELPQCQVRGFETN